MRTRITRTSTEGLQVVYDSLLSVTCQLGIGWDNGPFGGVGMSIQQAEELQGLLSEVLRLASPPIKPGFPPPQVIREGVVWAFTTNAPPEAP